jgi:hypothetical protein
MLPLEYEHPPERMGHRRHCQVRGDWQRSNVMVGHAEGTKVSPQPERTHTPFDPWRPLGTEPSNCLLHDRFESKDARQKALILADRFDAERGESVLVGRGVVWGRFEREAQQHPGWRHRRTSGVARSVIAEMTAVP